MLPYVLGRLRRRWAYTFGVVGLMAASLFLASFTVAGQIAGMFFRNCGAAILNITLSLYIMDHIKKNDLARAEPLRLSLSTFSWMIGPASGVWLYTQFGPWGPQLASIAVAMALLVLFWVLRLSDRVTMPSGTLQPFNPSGQCHALCSPAPHAACLDGGLRQVLFLGNIFCLWALADG